MILDRVGDGFYWKGQGPLLSVAIIIRMKSSVHSHSPINSCKFCFRGRPHSLIFGIDRVPIIFSQSIKTAHINRLASCLGEPVCLADQLAIVWQE